MRFDERLIGGALGERQTTQPTKLHHVTPPRQSLHGPLHAIAVGEHISVTPTCVTSLASVFRRAATVGRVVVCV